MPAVPAVHVIANRIRKYRENATPEQVTEGTAWYPAMGRLIEEIGRESYHFTGEPVGKSLACGVFAAYSQNATWKANVTMATRYLNGEAQGGLASVMDEIARMEDGEDPRTAIGHLKRPDFYSNLMGDLSHVTCDRWHLRIALGLTAAKHAKAKIELTPALHEAVTEATRRVAAEYGEEPATTQAIVWCAVRPSGDGK